MNHTAQNNHLERVFSRSCLESSPRPAAPHQGVFSSPVYSNSLPQSQLHQLKRRMLYVVLEEIKEAGLFKRICGAANQAAEQAWNTSYPLLVFPCLFEDLIQIVREQFQGANHGGDTE